MSPPRHIAVIDIGKTNAKLALVDLETLAEISVVTRPNTVLTDGPYPHFDVQGHWEFLLDALAEFHQQHAIDAISVTTHGASAVLLTADGELAAPVLDYEYAGPDTLAADYDAIRPAFADTGSPRLPGGLNVGAQLHWQFATDPTLLDRTAHILTYPQYWGHRLTGNMASDMSSMGCHTDLWLPLRATLSPLCDSLGIRDKIAPVRRATETLGTITQDVATRTGLSFDTPVGVGIHDSNASLYPHIRRETGALSVVSTGTWVVVMTMGGTKPALDPMRDTLINVNALGDPVPSARFMGGREFEIVQNDHPVQVTAEDVLEILQSQTLLLPAVQPGSGPFQHHQMRWVGREPAQGSGQRTAALSLYLALMTETCLTLTGAHGPSIIEGPFAQNVSYLKMLAVATGRPVFQSASSTGTSIGAALLMGSSPALDLPTPVDTPTDTSPWASYAKAWRAQVYR